MNDVILTSVWHKEGEMEPIFRNELIKERLADVLRRANPRARRWARRPHPRAGER